MTDLETRIARLEAKDDIRALKMRYARWCDRGWPPGDIDDVFVADGSWDGGDLFGRYVGKDEMLQAFGEFAKAVTWSLHYIGSGDITLADDLRSAESTWYIWQPLTMNGRALWHIGHYRDQHVQTPDGWRIKELVLHVEAFTPIERGWIEERFAATT